MTSALADADVLLRRRDEPDLRLGLADRDAERAVAFAAVGRTLRNLAMHSPAVFEAALQDVRLARVPARQGAPARPST